MKVTEYARVVARTHPWKLARVVGLLTLTNLADAASVLAIAPVVDLLITPDPAAFGRVTKVFERLMAYAGLPLRLWSVLTVFLVLNILRTSLHSLAWWFLLKTRYQILREITVQVFEEIMSAGWRFISSNPQGTLINTFTREMTNVDLAFLALGMVVTSLLQFVFYVSVPLMISWRVTGISVGLGVLLATPLILLGRLNYRWSRQATGAANVLTGAVQEGLLMAKVVLGFGNEQTNVARVSRAIETQTDQLIGTEMLSQTLPTMFQPVGLIAVCFSLTVARRLGVPLAETAALFYALFKLVPIMGQLVERKNFMDGRMSSVEQVEALRRRAAESREPAADKAFPGIKAVLQLEGVSVTHAADRTPALDGVSLRVAKGEIIALVGESGAGKTTAADVLAGLVPPSSGRVTVDGVPLTDYDPRSYRHRVGYVGQENMLFAASVRDNLLWVKPEATQAEMEAACRRAAAHEFVAALPQGYDTHVGDRGTSLSGGQIQRLALARALLREPDLLILDEATSALDGESELLVHAAVRGLRGRCAVVMVAHRLSTVRDADRIVVLKEGRVVEEGAFEDLIARNGAFTRLASLQGLAPAEKP